MHNKKESIDEILKSIREIMNNSNGNSSDIIELTEDDLVDQQDHDAYKNDINSEKSLNSDNINDFLTRLPHSIIQESSKTDERKEEEISAKDAAKSIEHIKNLIKKVDQSSIKSQIDKSNALEEIMLKALYPLLKEWIDKNLSSMVNQILEKELKNKPKTNREL